MAGISRHRYLRFNIQKTIRKRDVDGIEICEDIGHIVNSLLIFILERLQFETVAANKNLPEDQINHKQHKTDTKDNP